MFQMNEKLPPEMWLQILVAYVEENYKEHFDTWEIFTRNYANMEIWQEAYDADIEPEDAWEDEMSYWTVGENS
jgi:hypothetical protein